MIWGRGVGDGERVKEWSNVPTFRLDHQVPVRAERLLSENHEKGPSGKTAKVAGQEEEFWSHVQF